MSDTAMSDAVRAMVVLLPGVIVVGLSFAVLVSYSKAYLVDKRIQRVTHRPFVGLLTGHVTGISTSYIILVLFGIFEIIDRLDEPLTWRTPWLALAYIVGAFSLYKILRFERIRYRDTMDTPRNGNDQP